MKATRILSFFMVMLIMCSCFSFVSCSEEEVDANIPETPVYEATVSFEIRDIDGRELYSAVNYHYKWIKEPTILNIIELYLSAEEGVICRIDAKTNKLSKIGNKGGKKGEYWAYMNGTHANIKDIINDKKLQTQHYIDKIAMNDYNVLEQNCTSFTIVLAKV